MSRKNEARLRRARRARSRMRRLGVNRLSVHRTPRHIYAQVFAPPEGGGARRPGDKVLVSASTLDKSLRGALAKRPPAPGPEGSPPPAGKIAAAAEVGRLLAERAKAAGVDKVAFDRSGYKYHGRVKALAEAARANGLQF